MEGAEKQQSSPIIEEKSGYIEGESGFEREAPSREEILEEEHEHGRSV